MLKFSSSILGSILALSAAPIAAKALPVPSQSNPAAAKAIYNAEKLFNECEDGLKPLLANIGTALLEPSTTLNALKTIEHRAQALGNCEGYLIAVLDNASLDDSFQAKTPAFCVNQGTKASTLAETYVAYLKAHPEYRDNPAVLIVWNMLRQIFPCKP